EAPALLYLGAVGLAGWYGGIRPALVPTIIGALALDYFFETPRLSFAVSSPKTVVGLASFMFVAFLVGLLNDRLRVANVRLRAERDRAEAAVRARDELLATVSHALRTPLTTIQTSIFSLRDRQLRLAPARRASLLDNIAAEADRLVHFVSDALAIS